MRFACNRMEVTLAYFAQLAILLFIYLHSVEPSKMYNIHEVITRASFDQPTVKKDDSARFVCKYGDMVQFGENRFHAVITFPNKQRYISDFVPTVPTGMKIEFDETDNAYVVTIAHVTLKHAGEYICNYMTGSNSPYDFKIVEDAPERIAVLNVIVGTSPPLIQGAHLKDVKAGELHNLTCIVRKSYPQADIYWVDANGNSLHTNPSMYFETKTKLDGDDGLITTTSIMSFTPARNDDRKEVYCRAKNEADMGFKNDSVTLNVRYAPIVRLLIEPNLIDEQTTKVTATCEANSNPAVDSYKWYIGNKLIPNESSSVYFIRGVTEDTHQGKTVKCEATNSYGSSADSGAFNFVRKPEFTKIPNEEYKVILGDEVKLTCEAEGYPKPRIEWIRQGYDRVLSYENSLVIERADFSSAGTYICKAVVNNYYVTESWAKVTVFGPPSLLANRKKYSRVGSMVTLECSVSTRVTKPTNMYWTHNQLKFEQGQFVNKYIVEKKELNDSWTLSLTILDLKEENFGDYNCTVFNHAGNDTVTVSLLQPIVATRDEMPIIILGGCVASALLLVIFAIVIATICYCQQGSSGGKHHVVDQKAPDLPPSYRLDVGSPSHHMLSSIPSQPQQDYVDMDGVLMNGGTPPPPAQMFHTLPQGRGGHFFGSRADDMNSLDDGCKDLTKPFVPKRDWTLTSASVVDAINRRNLDSISPNHVNNFANQLTITNQPSCNQNSSEHDSSENGEVPNSTSNVNRSLIEGDDFQVCNTIDELSDHLFLSPLYVNGDKIARSRQNSVTSSNDVLKWNHSNRKNSYTFGHASGKTPILQSTMSLDTANVSQAFNPHFFPIVQKSHPVGSVELSTFKPGSADSSNAYLSPVSARPFSPQWNPPSDPNSPTPTNQRRVFYPAGIHPAYQSLNNSSQSFTTRGSIGSQNDNSEHCHTLGRQYLGSTNKHSSGKLNVVKRIPVNPTNHLEGTVASSYGTMARSPMGRVRYTPRNVRFVDLPRLDGSERRTPKDTVVSSGSGTLTRTSKQSKFI